MGSSRLGETDRLDDHHVELLQDGVEAKVLKLDRCLRSALPLSFLALSSCSGDFICYLFSYLQSEGNKSDLNYKRMLVKGLKDGAWCLVCVEERVMAITALCGHFILAANTSCVTPLMNVGPEDPYISVAQLTESQRTLKVQRTLM